MNGRQVLQKVWMVVTILVDYLANQHLCMYLNSTAGLCVAIYSKMNMVLHLQCIRVNWATNAGMRKDTSSKYAFSTPAYMACHQKAIIPDSQEGQASRCIVRDSRSGCSNDFKCTCSIPKPICRIFTIAWEIISLLLTQFCMFVVNDSISCLHCIYCEAWTKKMGGRGGGWQEESIPAGMVALKENSNWFFIAGLLVFCCCHFRCSWRCLI